MRFESNAVKIAPQAGILFRKRFIISPFLSPDSFFIPTFGDTPTNPSSIYAKNLHVLSDRRTPLATTSCKDEKVTTMQTITVNGQICEVKSAFYVEEKADEQWETSYGLILFREYFSTLPFTMSDYGVDIEVSESLIGKTIDLTEPVTQTGPLRPYLSVGAIGETEFDIVHSFERITVSNGDDISSATVSYGMLTVTRDGDNFSVKLSVKLSDGKSIFADWTGKATKVTIPE